MAHGPLDRSARSGRRHPVVAVRLALVAFALVLLGCSADEVRLASEEVGPVVGGSAGLGTGGDADGDAAVGSADRPIAQAGVDHWHQAYLVHRCGQDLPASETFESPIGIHTHADGIVHVHPFVDEQESTLGEYVASGGGVLTDDVYFSLALDVEVVQMNEEDGCDGVPAVLRLAYWPDGVSVDEPPLVYDRNLASFRFADGGAWTLALLPVDETIPPPPPDRLDLLRVVRGEPSEELQTAAPYLGEPDAAGR